MTRLTLLIAALLQVILLLVVPAMAGKAAAQASMNGVNLSSASLH